MRFTRLTLAASIVTMLALVAGCAQPTAAPTEAPAATATTAPEAAPAAKFRVAVVMPSAINDLAFSQSMYDALVAIQEEMGADSFEFAYSDGIFVVDDAAAAIRDYATQGYDLVIAHGSQYGSSLVEIAPDFPDTSFAWGTTVDTFTDQGIDNVFAYEARSEEGGYVLGVIAASLSQSGVLGVIGPIETGDAKLYVDGFKAGVLATKPAAQVNVNWTGSFSDVALASEAAQTHIDAGADALTGSAQMVVGAVGVAEENDVLWFGTQADQTSLAPDVVVASQVYDWTVVLDQIIELIHGGTRGGQAFALDLANGGLIVQYNPGFTVGDDVKALADETIQGIVDGTIDVFGALAAAPAKKFRVAVVMPSAINDLAFSQSMYDALVAIQDEMGADSFEFAYSDGMFVVDDAAAAIRDYATQGYDLVIAHGSQYGSSLVEIAPDFPDTSFAWGTTVDTFTDQGIDNVFAYEARSEEGGYVLGVIAASLSQSGVLGVIGPIETGDAKLYVDGFKAGVLATKPAAQVNVNWTGSFSDVALASEAAQTHIDAGADALTGSAQMVVGAVGVAEENDVLWFGTQADQTSLAPDVVVASQVYDWTVVLDQIIELIHGGTRGGQAFALDLANGGLIVQYNPGFSVGDDVKALADDTIQGIVDGTISVLE